MSDNLEASQDKLTVRATTYGGIRSSGNLISYPKEVTSGEQKARKELRDCTAAWVTTWLTTDRSRKNSDIFYKTGELIKRSCRVLEAAKLFICDEEILEIFGPVRQLIARSPFLKRLQVWPKGYAGDYETIEYLIDGINRSPEGTLEHHCETYALNSPSVQQHRNKIYEQARLIQETCITVGDSGARILSLGCGGCADLRLVEEAITPYSPDIVLLDVDEDALDFAQRSLNGLGKNCTFLHGNVVRMLRNILSEPYDLVLAGGLFDYLPDRAITFILEAVWEKGLR